MMSKPKYYILGALAMVMLVSFIGVTRQSVEKSEGAINWITIEEVEELSKTSPKKVFIDVYTDWCGYCKRMDRNTFTDPDVVAYVNEHFYAVKMNAESNDKLKFKGHDLTEAQFARSMRVNSYPTIVFIDESLDSIQPIPGYRTANQFRKLLEKVNGD